MNTWIIVGLVVAAIVIAGVVVLRMRQRTSTHLAQRFGPEYERTVGNADSKRQAEAELTRRTQRVEALQLRPLARPEQTRFATDWRTVQAQFVDDPAGAVGQADRLVGQVMQARGYPMGDFEQRVADISVDHAAVVEHYRAAHGIALRTTGAGTASTEELRQAMVHYRALFEDLLETPADPMSVAPDGTGRATSERKQEALA